jgi:NAD(P)H dehydrogenase (quinone)
MTKTVVIYHSGYGHTERVAQFVAEGAKAQIIAISAEGSITEADWAALDAADAIIFGAPTYMGMASWQFKKIADETSKRWFTTAW